MKLIEELLLRQREHYLKCCNKNDITIQEHKNGILAEESELDFNQQMIRQINHMLETCSRSEPIAKIMKKTIEIPLPNGYKIFIDNNRDKGIMVGLINQNGFTVSDRVLTEETAEQLKRVTG